MLEAGTEDPSEGEVFVALDVSTYKEVGQETVTSVVCQEASVVLIQGRSGSQQLQVIDLSREQLEAALEFAKETSVEK